MSEISRTVLVVDDDPIFLAVVSALLRQRLGILAVGVGTVARAMDVVRETERLGIIISDLNLPESNGLEFAASLAELGISCPLLFVSGAVKAVAKGAAPLAQSYGLNVIGTLPKPLDHDVFIKTVTRALRHGS